MKKAFTLIELLVVIAIIAILAAILFPVFAQAKAAAKKASAISNAKQLLLGEIMYSNDYDDMCVPYFSGYNVGGTPRYTSPQVYWPQLISAYVQKVSGSGPGGTDGTEAQAQSEDLSKVFFDPIETFKSQKGDANCSNGLVASWGISDDFVNWWEPDGVHTTYLPINMSQVNAPAGVAIFVETWDWLCEESYPGSTLALSFFDDNHTFDSGTFVPGSLNGAIQSLQSPYQASYVKTTTDQEPDPNGIQNPGFADGHVKSMHTGLLTHTGASWSIGGNDMWP
jgi:prepilin-type N-terminal cleavage/methylation domain-containing protein